MRRRQITTPTIFIAAQRTRRMSKTKYCFYDYPAKSYLSHQPTSSRRSWHIIIPKAVTLPNFCIRKCTSSQLTPRQRPQSLPFFALHNFILAHHRQRRDYLPPRYEGPIRIAGVVADGPISSNITLAASPHLRARIVHICLTSLPSGLVAFDSLLLSLRLDVYD